MSLAQSPRAVVTGGASGLGRGFCVELGARRGRVIVADLNVAGAEETAALVRQAGGEAIAVRADVTKIEDVEGLAVLAEQRFGGADLVVNNAGVAVGGEVGEVPLEDWRWIVDINLFGVVHGCHVFVPRFRRAGRGHVINVASAAGLVSSKNMAPYNATKAAVVALSETLSGELADTGVGVTVLCPTFFPTQIVESGRVHGDLALKNMATKLMEQSKFEARDVARIALDGADAGQLYVVPMADGRWMWRMKRLAPSAFYKTLVPRVMRMMTKKGAASR